MRLPSASRTIVSYCRLFPSDKSLGYFQFVRFADWLPSAFCFLPSAFCSLEPFPKPDLKTVVVVARAQISRRTLFVLRHKRNTIRYAIFECQDLIWIGCVVRRVSHLQGFGVWSV